MDDSLSGAAGYEYHPAVFDDIYTITSYIAKNSVASADRVYNRITERIRGLVPAEVRYQGHRRPDLTNRPLLFVTVYDYLIVYDPQSDPMLILGILHGMQNPEKLASLLGSRQPQTQAMYGDSV